MTHEPGTQHTPHSTIQYRLGTTRKESNPTAVELQYPAGGGL